MYHKSHRQKVKVRHHEYRDNIHNGVVSKTVLQISNEYVQKQKQQITDQHQAGMNVLSIKSLFVTVTYTVTHMMCL